MNNEINAASLKREIDDLQNCISASACEFCKVFSLLSAIHKMLNDGDFISMGNDEIRTMLEHVHNLNEMALEKMEAATDTLWRLAG